MGDHKVLVFLQDLHSGVALPCKAARAALITLVAVESSTRIGPAVQETRQCCCGGLAL